MVVPAVPAARVLQEWVAATVVPVAMAVRAQATVARVVRAVPVVLVSPLSRRARLARTVVRVARVAPVAVLWREPRVTVALLVPVVTVVLVPTVTLAHSLVLPAVKAGMPER